MTPRDPLEPTIAALRRLARGLLYDAHGAEDVVQEAWLAALRRPVASARSGGWLTETVRRLAFNRRREEARRHAREVRAARGEAQPAVDEAAGRTEVLRSVLDALDRLPEPYRETVALRYLDDLAPREIARRRSLPVNTVRTHLRRGLERLRADLEGEEGRDRRDWLAALVAFAGPAVPALHPLSADSSLPGGLSMKTLATSVLALPLVVLGTWYGFVHEPRSPVPEPVTSPQATVASGPGEITAPTQDTGTRTPVETTRAADEGWTLRGHVSRGRREPFPGARVLGRVYAGTVPEGEPLVEATVLADAHGEYAFPIAPPEQLVCVRLAVDEPGVTQGDLWDVFGAGDAPSGCWDLRTYPADARVVGTIRGPNGTPIAGARVVQRWTEPEPPVIVTDAEGRFEAPGSSARGAQDWYVFADGMARGRIDQDLVPGDNEVEVTLLAERRLRGRVVDADGQPIEGALLSAVYPHELDPHVTNGDGRFEIGAIGLDEVEERRASLGIQKAGFQGTNRSIDVGDLLPDGEVEVVLERAIELSGRVVDAAGNPVPGTQVSRGYGVYPPSWTYTDDEGRFALDSLREGENDLWAWRVGFGQTRHDVVVPEGATRVTDALIVLREAHHLGGVVQGAEGTPIPYAMVWAGSPERVTKQIEGWSQNADAEGRFRFEGLPDVPVVLTVLEQGQAPLHQRVDGLDRDDVVLQVAPAGVLRGLVVDASGAPVPRFTVFSGPVDSNQNWTSRPAELRVEDASGTFEVRGRLTLQESYRIEVRAPGHVPKRAMAVAEANPDPAASVIRLTPGATITGQVVDQDGRPVTGARVTVRAGLDRARAISAPRTANTDPDGRFTFDGIESGEVTLFVVAGEPGHVDGPFEVVGPAPIDRRIEIGGAGGSRGACCARTGRPGPERRSSRSARRSPRANGASTPSRTLPERSPSTSCRPAATASPASYGWERAARSGTSTPR